MHGSLCHKSAQTSGQSQRLRAQPPEGVSLRTQCVPQREGLATLRCCQAVKCMRLGTVLSFSADQSTWSARQILV